MAKKELNLKSYFSKKVTVTEPLVASTSCRGAKKFGLLTLSKHQKSAFVEDGFGNWKKGLQKFLEHEKSDMHREAADRLAAKSSGRNVATLLNTNMKWRLLFTERCC